MNIFSSPASRTVDPAASQERLAIIVQTATTALRDPAHNPIVMLVILGVVAVLLLIILLVVALVVRLVQDWRNPPPPPVARMKTVAAERNPLIEVFTWLIVILALVGGVNVGWRYGISDRTCARCHITESAFASRATDVHAKVACSSCHVAPGARGSFLGAVTAVKNLRSQLAGPPERPSSRAEVQSAACLACHKSVAQGVLVASSIRMRHSDVLSVGYRCADCHTVGHGTAVIAKRNPSMAQCLQCHDGTTASSRCATCHSKDVGVASGRRAIATDIPKAQIVVDGCRGCHSMAPCIQCHGIELPHSGQFRGGSHARKALLQPKTCVKCHGVASFCNVCHQFRVAGGLPLGPHGNRAQFVSDHSKLGRTFNDESASCYCHTRGGPRKKLCAFCHGPQPSR